MASEVTPSPALRPGVLDDIPGWFFAKDRLIFDWFLRRQERTGTDGDLLELGAYLGKSAVVLGEHLRPAERLTVCDLFDSDAPDDDNGAEMTMSYRSTLTRDSFEANYLAFHDELPVIVQAPTSVLADGRIPEGSCRFVHVDASHLYEHVALDIKVARRALAPEGVIALDDFRSEHTPGVAAAVWEAVLSDGLRPICISSEKFYGTWGDPEPFQEELLREVKGWERCRTDVQTVSGHRIVRIEGKQVPVPGFRVSRYHAALEAERAAARPAPAAADRRQASLLRRTARDLLPPVVTRAIVRNRKRAAAAKTAGKTA
ncbi:class I SAM-dependent methyltransferase [Streptacidiphilus albus]|uniref:class I SAM-dependent methyltransferase n=1 Tax=Streptacidiphilus albus TaxID=105425 RepID=UPI0005A62FDE|nr:class I SAM-dependent methyltransferase [Streptacidiphilus albus]